MCVRVYTPPRRSRKRYGDPGVKHHPNLNKKIMSGPEHPTQHLFPERLSTYKQIIKMQLAPETALPKHMQSTPELNRQRALSLWLNDFASVCIPGKVSGTSNADTRMLQNIIKSKQWTKVVLKDRLEALLMFSVSRLNSVDQDLLRSIISVTWSRLNARTGDRFKLQGSIITGGQALTKTDHMLSKIAANIGEKGTAIACKDGFLGYFSSLEFEAQRRAWAIQVAKLFPTEEEKEAEETNTTTSVTELARAAAEAARVASAPGRITVAVASMPASNAAPAAAVGVPVAASAVAASNQPPPVPAPAVEAHKETTVEDAAMPDAEIAAEHAPSPAPTSAPAPASPPDTANVRVQDLDEDEDENREVVVPAQAPAPARASARARRAEAARFPMPNGKKPVDAANVQSITLDTNTGSYFESEFEKCSKWARSNNSTARELEYMNKAGFRFFTIRRLNNGLQDPYVAIVQGSRADKFATRAGVHKKRLRSKGDIRKWWSSVIASGIDLSSF